MAVNPLHPVTIADFAARDALRKFLTPTVAETTGDQWEDDDISVRLGTARLVVHSAHDRTYPKIPFIK